MASGLTELYANAGDKGFGNFGVSDASEPLRGIAVNLNRAFRICCTLRGPELTRPYSRSQLVKHKHRNELRS